MFDTEQQLINTLKENYSSICHWNTTKFNTKILEEVNLGFGKADLIITRINSIKSPQTVSLNYFDAVVYKIIRSKKTLSFENLKAITKSDASKLNKALSKLVKDSYINKTDALIKIKNSYKGLESDSIAIEAKLKNWRRALEQAYRYKWFARKTFVVLDSAHIKPAIKNIDYFKKMNVGLAQINNHGDIKLHFNPSKKAPIDYSMWILLNETLKTLFLG